MPNQELENYIQQSRQAGKNDDQIRQELLSAGWSVQDINDSLYTSAPLVPRLELSEDKTPEPDGSKSNSRFNLKKLFKPLVILLAVVLVIVVAYFVLDSYLPQVAKFVQPYLGPVLDPVNDSINSIVSNLPIIGGAPYKPDDILSAFAKTALINSAKYNASALIETQDKDPNLKPLVIDIPQGEIPADLKGALSNSSSYIFSPPTLNSKKKSRSDDALIIEISELKEVMNKKAIDDAKLRLVTSILTELGYYYSSNKKDPLSLADLSKKSDKYYSNYYGYIDKWAALDGKYFTYKVSSDQKSFKLTVTFDSEQTVSNLKESINKIKSDSYYGKKYHEGSISFEGKTVTFNERSVGIASYLNIFGYRNQSAAEQWAALFSDDPYASYLSYIPGRFKLNFNVGGIMQGSGSKGFYIQLGGKADFEDLVVEADAEFTNIDKESFLRINKFPSIFMDVSKVRGDWIKLPAPSSKSSDPYSYNSYDPYSYYGESVQKSITEYREKSDKQLVQWRKILSIAEQEKIIKAEGAAIKEDLDGKTTYKYLVTIDENKLPAFYEKAAAALKEYGDEAMIPETEIAKTFVNSAGFKEIIKYIKKVSDFYIWVDSSGYIVKYEYNIKYIPHTSSDLLTGEQSGSKQFYISANVVLMDINKNLEVEKPSKYIEWKDAISKLFGVAAEQLEDAQAKARDAKRIADVSQIRTAVELYFDDNKSEYPKEITWATLSDYFLKEIPKDPQTGKAYNYSYYPANKPTGFQVWTQLETHSVGLNSDADINSDKLGWVGSKIDASKEETEECEDDYDNGAARDCIYDIGQSDAYNYEIKASNFNLGSILLLLSGAVSRN